MTSITVNVSVHGKIKEIDLSSPIDITIPVSSSGVRAFHISPPSIEPFSAGSFIGDVRRKGSCNCEVIHLTPHGNGTHTECIGHITPERIFISDCLNEPFFLAKLIDVAPKKIANGDLVIDSKLIESNLGDSDGIVGLIIRTIPNDKKKLTTDYSGTNPPYLLPEATELIAKHGFKHLLLDLPSVDREDDGGKLLAHRGFWLRNGKLDASCTITEFIYVPSSVVSGNYLVNLQIPALPSDAAPSRVLMWKV